MLAAEEWVLEAGSGAAGADDDPLSPFNRPICCLFQDDPGDPRCRWFLNCSENHASAVLPGFDGRKAYLMGRQIDRFPHFPQANKEVRLTWIHGPGSGY